MIYFGNPPIPDQVLGISLATLDCSFNFLPGI